MTNRPSLKIIGGPLAWAAAVIAVLAIAFMAVYTTFATRAVSGVDWRDAERVRDLERVAKQLDVLLSEIDHAPSKGSLAERALWEDDIRTDLRPRVKEFQRAILVDAQQGRVPEKLLVAADRLAAAAANPGDKRALQAAHESRDALWAEVGAELARVQHP